MLLPTFAFRNVLRHGRRNLTILALVAAGAALLVSGDAVLASADRGIRTSFVDGFTADFSLSVSGEESFSLFGNEVPLVGDYAVTPLLPRHDEIKRAASKLPGVAKAVSVVSGISALDCAGWSDKAIFFGVSPDEYFAAFPALKITKGELLKEGESGVLLNEKQYETITKAAGRAPAIGESVGFSVFNDSGFSLRSAPLRGVFAYASPSDATDRICLVDADTARSLNGYLVGSDDVGVAVGNSTVAAENIDDLFASSEGIVSSSGSIDLASIEKSFADDSARAAATRTRSDGWNFILLKLEPGAKASRIGPALVRSLREVGLDAKVLDWRGTAGNQAQMIFILRVIFIAGLAILSVAALVIIINSLVITVLERAGEIGMMRAIGASRAYVCLLFLFETLFVTAAGALVGTVLGSIAVAAVGKVGIGLSNPLLASLFGASRLRPSLDLLQAFWYFLAATVVGSVSWIYPVSLVLKSQPALAMTKANE